jgi:hypothetical protein
MSLNLEMLGSHIVSAARFTAIALGVSPRYSVSADLRVRLFRSFYLYGAAGTLIFPQPLGSLSRGVFVSAGVGVDFDTVL